MRSVRIKRLVKAIGAANVIVALMTFTWWVAKELVGPDTGDVFFFDGKRRLLTKEDKCAHGGMGDPLNFTHPAAGILYFIGMMWTFVSMGQVCEDYFVSALNAMVHKWNISPDFAGATFMAAGTSMPEVFAASVGLFLSSNGSDAGINTVVGSTVFNTVCIIGGSIIVYPAPGLIKLPPISLIRDSLFFVTAVASLYILFEDTIIDLKDCISLLAIYCCYVTVCSLTPMIDEFVARFIDQGEVEISKPSVQFQLEEQPLVSPRTAARKYSDLSPSQSPKRLGDMKYRKSSGSLRSEVYSGVPHDKNVAQIYHSNYELMLRTRANVVSALFGLPKGDMESDVESLNIEPLRDTANAVGLDQLRAVEMLFLNGSKVFHQPMGGDLQLAGKYHPIKVDVLVVDIKKHSPGVSPTDSQWTDLVEALNSYELPTISKTDFIPIYKTWYQCSRVLQLPLVIYPFDVEHMTETFDRVIGPSTHPMTVEEVMKVAQQLTLSPFHKMELRCLLKSTKLDDCGSKLTPSGCKTLFLQWTAYARSLLSEDVCLASPRTRVSHWKFDTRCVKIMRGEKSEEEEDIPIHTVFKMPESGLGRLLYVIGLPMSILLYLSVPDCRRPNLKNWFLPSIVISMMWLVVLVYLMLNWAEKWGCLWGVNPSLMGMTVTAAGTSLPDFLASITVSRAGEGQMSVTNAFGSNIFGIGLGLPFALKVLVTREPVEFQVRGLFDAAIFLIGLQCLFVIIVYIYKLTLPKVFGYYLVASYVVFLVYQIIALS